eukprot:3586843-Rhodomonas_salina.8
MLGTSVANAAICLRFACGTDSMLPTRFLCDVRQWCTDVADGVNRDWKSWMSRTTSSSSGCTPRGFLCLISGCSRQPSKLAELRFPDKYDQSVGCYSTLALAVFRYLRSTDTCMWCYQTLPVEIGKLKKLKVPVFRGTNAGSAATRNKLEGVPANLLRGGIAIHPPMPAMRGLVLTCAVLSGDAAIFAFWKGMCESMRTKVFDISNSGMTPLAASHGTMHSQAPRY